MVGVPSARLTAHPAFYRYFSRRCVRPVDQPTDRSSQGGLVTSRVARLEVSDRDRSSTSRVSRACRDLAMGPPSRHHA